MYDHVNTMVRWLIIQMSWNLQASSLITIIDEPSNKSEDKNRIRSSVFYELKSPGLPSTQSYQRRKFFWSIYDRV